MSKKNKNRSLAVDPVDFFCSFTFSAGHFEKGNMGWEGNLSFHHYAVAPSTKYVKRSEQHSEKMIRAVSRRESTAETETVTGLHHDSIVFRSHSPSPGEQTGNSPQYRFAQQSGDGGREEGAGNLAKQRERWG